jgi:RNA polymerase sigma factor (sigma-70 family)
VVDSQSSWNEDEWRRLLRGLIDGDQESFAAFWDRYGERLNRLANGRLPRHMQRRIESDDVVQSVCRTFFRRMREGRLDLRKHQQIWPLLCAITLNKVRMQIRYQLQDKRHPGREVPLGPADGESQHSRPFDVAEEGVDPQQAVAFAEQLERILGRLDKEQRQIIELRLEGCNGEEIADRLNISTRTVRRITSRIREQLAHDLLSDLGNETS